MVAKSISILGQWVGHFKYGACYGEEVYGEKVEFRLFISEGSNKQFEGTSVDIEGVGANFEQAVIKGFLEGDFISFTKQYAHFYALNEDGTTFTDETQKHPTINYEGHYNSNRKSFSGSWEMHIDINPVGEHWLVEVLSGTWEMTKDES